MVLETHVEFCVTKKLLIFIHVHNFLTFSLHNLLKVILYLVILNFPIKQTNEPP